MNLNRSFSIIKKQLNSNHHYMLIQKQRSISKKQKEVPIAYEFYSLTLQMYSCAVSRKVGFQCKKIKEKLKTNTFDYKNWDFYFKTFNNFERRSSKTLNLKVEPSESSQCMTYRKNIGLTANILFGRREKYLISA